MKLNSDKQLFDQKRPGLAESHDALSRQLDEAQQILGLIDADIQESIKEQGALERSGMTPEDIALANEMARVLDHLDAIDPELEQVRRDGTFKLRIEDENWLVKMDLYPPVAGGKLVTPKQIVRGLFEIGVTHGIDRVAIKQALVKHRDGEEVERHRVAIGREPVQGKAGKVDLFCRSGLTAKPKRIQGFEKLPARPNQRICCAGDMVLSHRSATVGKAGFDVTGSLIEPDPVHDLAYEAGENVSKQGNTLYANIDGTIEVDRGVVSVVQSLVVAEIEPGREEIKYDGNIIIDCSVTLGTSVIASGDITVNGGVGPAVLTSTRGSVYLVQGVAGQDATYISAAKSIHAKYAEHAVLQAGDAIILDTGALHATMGAGNRIESLKGKGAIVGGALIAGERIDVKHLGNASGVTTTVFCGYGPEAFAQRSEQLFRQAEYQAKLEKLNEAAQQIRRMVGEISQLSEEGQRTYAQLLKGILAMRSKLAMLSESDDAMEHEAETPEHTQISCLETLHAGCEVAIGGATMSVTKPKRRSKATLDHDRVSVTPI